ncbi:Txe/YoeB family addiction module toxin [Limosilactobacillus reuteri]|uniref:Endoribonuclease YoeB n=1 Tax=Limosilactobacillus reuteri TaxID=1598 RepID=A0ABD6Y6A0_LIMRT|nr:Txe/YoeB family addiction module toxin [Limosilactobacillus reuteri]PWT37199.1 Txe/YoeB family addiction module toxin [Limosilactobacillus reuteri]PWT41047.1 Txe/YoeB family addiction module toxin [Limosilactobacillus reuteri]
MSYTIKSKKGARRDFKKIKGTYLEKSFLEIINQLKSNPYKDNQSFEKLVPPIKGFYSRRINVQHRVVYKVNEEEKKVIIYSAWGHYK